MSKKSKDLIVATLLQLMESDLYHEITVSEICAWAKIARRTFYNNFSTKEDVLREACSNLITESLSAINDQPNYVSAEFWIDFLSHFFETNRQHSIFLGKLMNQNLFHLYVRLLLDMSENSVLWEKLLQNSLVSNKNTKYTLTAYSAVAVSMYEVWYYNGFKESPEELGTIYLSFISGN